MYWNLRKEMKKHGLSQQDLADFMGISRQAFSNKINGRANLLLSEAIAIRDKFFPNKSLDYLFVDE